MQRRCQHGGSPVGVHIKSFAGCTNRHRGDNWQVACLQQGLQYVEYDAAQDEHDDGA